MSGPDDQHIVVIGRISGLHGVHGAVRIFSHTRPRERILSYDPWLLSEGGVWRERRLIRSGPAGRSLVANLEGITDRDAARGLIGSDIGILRQQLPVLPEGEYYWCDLLGLEVFDRSSARLGKVVDIRETGANDVLVVEGEKHLLIPLVIGPIVTAVELEQGRMVVDWNPEYL